MKSAWPTVFCASLVFATDLTVCGQNLLKNPGFEEDIPSTGTTPNWTTTADSVAKATVSDTQARSGSKAIAIPANTSIEQRVDSLQAGAYLARCWVKSEAEQSVTFLLRDSDEPWTAYTCAEIRVPRDQWTHLEAFCALDRKGGLTLTLGGPSKPFHLYHGTSQDMGAPIIADDFELVRYQSTSVGQACAWDAKKDQNLAATWLTKDGWTRVDNVEHAFAGMPVLQGGRLLGAVRPSDGALVVYSVQQGPPQPQCAIVPAPSLSSFRCKLLQEPDRMGVRITSSSEERSYTAWLSADGLIRVEASHIPQIQLQNCRLRYALLPSLAGADLCYTPADVSGTKDFNLPSTQWFVGLADGNQSMLVATWQTNDQSIAVRAEGTAPNQLIETLTLGTEHNGFSLGLIEHTNIWHRESLNEDWLGEYVPISWERPFPARWMGRFFVTSGGMSTFRDPGIGYSFPIASAKTRMWGLWFEDWNHYPFFFDGSRTVVHFEKTFVPQGEALIYFLEPAAADLMSPCEIVEKALGHEQAMELFDLEANGLRKLKYSTPNTFLLDRPVCATTTRLSKIKQDEKAGLGVDLATHLYEFIREIRGRVDEYAACFAGLKNYLEAQKREHPELRDYAEELEAMVSKAQTQSEQIYATPLSTVQEKIEKMKALLREGQGDGFDCGKLDVRNTAGAQDDLCRRYNRYVIKLTQTASLKCGDSPQKAAIATYIWSQSRQILRQPTRWEPRRTLYFFEP